jgi:uncharacterized protein YjdB
MKLLSAFVIALAIAISTLPASAIAETLQDGAETKELVEVIANGQTSGTKYATVTEAIKNAENKATVKLLADVSEDFIKVVSNKVSTTTEETKVARLKEGVTELTIDLDGHTLTLADRQALVLWASDTTFTIKGGKNAAGSNGTIVSTYLHTEDKGTYHTTGGAILYTLGHQRNTNLVLENVDFLSSKEGNLNTALYLPATGNTTITNCIIESGSVAIEDRGSNLTLTNCTLIGGSGVTTEDDFNSGTTVMNAGLAISQYNNADITATIKGGSITGYTALDARYPSAGEDKTINVTVEDATFNGTFKIDEKATVSITSGKFQGDPSPYVAPNTSVTGDEQYYTVAPATTGDNKTLVDTISNAVTVEPSKLAEELTVAGTTSTVKFDAKAIATLKAKVGESNTAEITMNTQAELSEEAAKVLNELPVSQLLTIDVSVMVGSVAFDFTAGDEEAAITVSVPKDAFTAVPSAVYYVDTTKDEGNLEVFEVEASDDAYSFTTSHLSTYTFVSEEPTGTISYSGHIENKGDQPAVSGGFTLGSTGEGLRLEEIAVTIDTEYAGGIEYRGHVQNIGWGDYYKDGEKLGTEGQGLRLEAVQFELTGEVAEHYDVYYRVHVENYGWMEWAKNGELAGTQGRGLRIEAIEMELVSKNGGFHDFDEADFEYSFDGALVGGEAHVENLGWTAASNGFFGTTGQGLRMEAVKFTLDTSLYKGELTYRAHAQNYGWRSYVNVGSVAGTEGEGLRLEAITMKLEGEMAEHLTLQYRVHVENLGWSGWMTSGEDAGSEGLGLRAEAIEVRFVAGGAANGSDEVETPETPEAPETPSTPDADDTDKDAEDADKDVEDADKNDEADKDADADADTDAKGDEDGKVEETPEA